MTIPFSTITDPYQSYLPSQTFLNALSLINFMTTFILISYIIQGSTLGPLFFIIYINDIVFVSAVFKSIIYADDTTLYPTLNSLQDSNKQQNLNEIINYELSKISTWLKVNYLSLNVNKSKFLAFCTPQTKIRLPTLHIDGSELECVEEFNFLGITNTLVPTTHVTPLSASHPAICPYCAYGFEK